MDPIIGYLNGDQIARFSRESFVGNNDQSSLVLHGRETLGSERDTFRIEIFQTNGADTMGNGQFVTILEEVDGEWVPVPGMERMNPKHDEFQGRAASTSHQVFSDQDVVIDLGGIDFPMVYNKHTDDAGRLPFRCLMQVPCFLEGTLIRLWDGDDVPVETLAQDNELAGYIGHGYHPRVRCVMSHVTGEPLYFIHGMTVTGQHRVVYTNSDGVVGLIAAKHHPQAVEVHSDKPRRVYSVFCERPRIIFAQGSPVSSSKPGKELRKMLGDKKTEKLQTILGDLDVYCEDSPLPEMNKRGEVK